MRGKALSTGNHENQKTQLKEIIHAEITGTRSHSCALRFCITKRILTPTLRRDRPTRWSNEQTLLKNSPRRECSRKQWQFDTYVSAIMHAPIMTLESNRRKPTSLTGAHRTRYRRRPRKRGGSARPMDTMDSRMYPMAKQTADQQRDRPWPLIPTASTKTTASTSARQLPRPFGLANARVGRAADRFRSLANAPETTT